MFLYTKIYNFKGLDKLSRFEKSRLLENYCCKNIIPYQNILNVVSLLPIGIWECS